MSPRHGLLISRLAIPILLLHPANGAAQPSPLDLDVTGWTRDVQRHEPGTFDAAAQRVVNLSWTELRPILEKVSSRGDEVLLLKSAVLLTDVAMHVPLERRPSLATAGKAVISEDGELRKIGVLDSHLLWSRRLVDRVAREPESARHGEMRARVIAWYRAVTSWLASRMNLADLGPHVQRSLERFRDDAGVMFDAGCYFETYASPLIQASMPTEESPVPRRGRFRPRDMMRTSATSKESLLAEAEKHFRRALELDPSLVEARVRLGRVLTLRGRAREALIELRKPPAPVDRPVQYFSLMFAGNALEHTGEPASAAKAFQAAARVFPEAQSPRLALSRLALESGDQAAARAILEQMHSIRTEADEDPWWIYHHGTGRDTDSILQTFADQMRALPAGGGAERARR